MYIHKSSCPIYSELRNSSNSKRLGTRECLSFRKSALGDRLRGISKPPHLPTLIPTSLPATSCRKVECSGVCSLTLLSGSSLKWFMSLRHILGARVPLTRNRLVCVGKYLTSIGLFSMWHGSWSWSLCHNHVPQTQVRKAFIESMGHPEKAHPTPHQEICVSNPYFDHLRFFQIWNYNRNHFMFTINQSLFVLQ